MNMILKSSHTLIFMWYLWALDVEDQRVLRPKMIIMIDPDVSVQDRYDAYVHLNENMSHLAKEQDADTTRLRDKTRTNRRSCQG